MKISFPRLMLVTDSRIMRPTYAGALESALAGGDVFVQLREKDLEPRARRELAETTATTCQRNGAAWTLNGDLELASDLSCGLHLPEADHECLWTARAVLGDAPIGISCHSLESAQRAQDAGADYLVFGSIFPTSSHPGINPVGLERLSKVAGAVELPVFAIGGIDENNASLCLQAGAHGVAVIRAVWSSADPGKGVTTLLESLDVLCSD